MVESKLLAPAQAIEEIRNALPVFAAEHVPLLQSAGRILRQAVVAERDQPPFDRVMMDGIAIRFQALQSGRRTFHVQGTQQAGDRVQTLSDVGNCIEIMTGAAMPIGTDCVVPVERIAIDNGNAVVEDAYAATQSQFVHPKGSDYRGGQTLLNPGLAITSMDIAVIASCGMANVAVSCIPSIRVISTGNELVPAGSPILPHQIRLSNGPAVVAMLAKHGFHDCEHEHLVDDPAMLRESLAQHLDEAQVMILSGGVSMGKADFVPQVLADLGVHKVFHRISQQPGKPMWFGMGPQQQAVFALPGNPVSTLVCCRHYVLPALLAASGRTGNSVPFAVLSQDVTYQPALTRFLPVRISSRDDGMVIAVPAPTNTSGDFTALSGTAGYVELRNDQSEFPAGTVVPLHLWDRP